MKKLSLAIALAAATGPGMMVLAAGGPADDTLVIDGQTMITRAPAPEGHTFPEVLSGWLFREAETRATEADSFANPGMLAVESVFGTLEECVESAVRGEVWRDARLWQDAAWGAGR